MGDGLPRPSRFSKEASDGARAHVPWGADGPLLRVARRVPKIWTTPILSFRNFFRNFVLRSFDDPSARRKLPRVRVF